MHFSNHYLHVVDTYIDMDREKVFRYIFLHLPYESRPNIKFSIHSEFRSVEAGTLIIEMEKQNGRNILHSFFTLEA